MRSFCGVLSEIPDIYVDNFEDHDARAYFLSHCHCDHIPGLSSPSFLTCLSNKQPPSYIYTSEVSAIIIENSGINVSPEIMEFIKPLHLGNTHIILPEDGKNNKKEVHIDVTLLPAAHCLGSVMFLFRTNTTVLYTGDIRISVNDISNFTKLHEKDNVIDIDTLYVDTTFYDDDHKEFPSRKESIQHIIRFISEWLGKDDGNRVFLSMPAKYGYEHLYNEIYKQLKVKVYVNAHQWKVYSKIPSVYGVTNDLKQDKIHVCKKSSHRNCVGNWISDDKFLQIYITACKWRDFKTDDNIFYKYKDCNRIDVCFSTHSSKSELDYFINYLKPKKAIGFINGVNVLLNVKERCNLEFEINSVKRRKLMTPEKEVNERKLTQNEVKDIFF